MEGLAELCTCFLASQLFAVWWKENWYTLRHAK